MTIETITHCDLLDENWIKTEDWEDSTVYTKENLNLIFSRDELYLIFDDKFNVAGRHTISKGDETFVESLTMDLLKEDENFVKEGKTQYSTFEARKNITSYREDKKINKFMTKV